MSFPQIPFSVVRSRKLAIASSDLVQANALSKAPVLLPKLASSDLVLPATELMAVTGDFYLASSDLQIAASSLVAQVSRPATDSINDKIIAYWKFDSSEFREYTTGSFAEFFVDSAGDPSLAYALNNTSLASVTFGLIGNALIPAGSVSLYANQTITDPATNGFNFIGVAWWIKLTTTDFSSWASSESRSRSIYSSNYHSLTVTVTTPDPMDIGSIFITYEFFQNGSARTANISGSSLNDYHLLVCEVNRGTGEMNLRLNTGSASIGTYTEPPFAPYDLVVGDNSSNFDLQIDESFMFKEHLTDIEVAAIYNGSAGQTYPFP